MTSPAYLGEANAFVGLILYPSEALLGSGEGGFAFFGTPIPGYLFI